MSMGVQSDGKIVLGATASSGASRVDFGHRAPQYQRSLDTDLRHRRSRHTQLASAAQDLVRGLVVIAPTAWS